MNLPVTLDGEILRAQNLRTTGDYDEALRSLAQLMLFAPDDPRVVGEYGKVLAQMGRSQEAVAYLKRAVELNPREWSLHSALGVAYDQLDDHKSARLAYEKALSLKPGEGSVLNNFGVSRMLAGDYPTARKLFEEAQAAGSPNPKIALNLDKLENLSPHALAVASAVASTPKVSAPAIASAAPSTPKASAPTAAATNRMPLPVTVQPTPAPRVVMQRVPVDPLATRKTPISVAAKSPTAQVATVAPKPVGPQAVMQQQRPVDPLASHTVSVATKTRNTQVATAAPKPLGPQVVMQRVPFDPLAGPVARHSSTRASAQKAKTTASKPADTTPSLRTAADSD
jgi:Flp pilus assembly protein TadD